MSDQRQSVLITGCSGSGIGNAMAREFHARGFRVFATARNKDSLDDLAKLGIDTLSLEVNSIESIRAAKAAVVDATGGKLNHLINNAGRTYVMPAIDVDIDEVRLTFETNVFATMRITQEFMGLLVNAKGTVAFIGSLAGVMPYVFGSTYNASKAALHAYANTLRIEVAPFGVRTVIVVTGGVKSNIARTKRSLPPDSLYLEIDEAFQRRLNDSQEGAMDSEAYAREVVGKLVLASPPKWMWAGNRSFYVWFMDTFRHRGVWDSILSRAFGLAYLATRRRPKAD